MTLTLTTRHRDTVQNARVLARHAKRASITQDDINQSLTILGYEVL